MAEWLERPVSRAGRSGNPNLAGSNQDPAGLHPAGPFLLTALHWEPLGREGLWTCRHSVQYNGTTTAISYGYHAVPHRCHKGTTQYRTVQQRLLRVSCGTTRYHRGFMMVPRGTTRYHSGLIRVPRCQSPGDINRDCHPYVTVLSIDSWICLSDLPLVIVFM